jgi:hypothetical protein
MSIFRNKREINSIYRNGRSIMNVYRNGRVIWSNAVNVIKSCFALGYWIDKYKWTDDKGWKD